MTKSMVMTIPVTDNNGDVIKDQEAKIIRRATVKSLLKSGTIRLNYIRTAPYVQKHSNGSEVVSKGNPYGVVVSEIRNNRLYFGWSLLHTRDAGKYDRDFGILQAVNRFQPFETYLNTPLPDDVRRTMAHLVARNVLYFKRKVEKTK